jgi:hypothetical protein
MSELSFAPRALALCAAVGLAVLIALNAGVASLFAPAPVSPAAPAKPAEPLAAVWGAP